MSTLVAAVDVPKESSELPVHVLIVDDQEVVRELCSEIADALGYRVSMAASGEKALEVLEREHVDRAHGRPEDARHERDGAAGEGQEPLTAN